VDSYLKIAYEKRPINDDSLIIKELSYKKVVEPIISTCIRYDISSVDIPAASNPKRETVIIFDFFELI